MEYPEILGKNTVIGENGLLTNIEEAIVVDTSAIEAAISISLAEDKTKRLMEARKLIALENIAEQVKKTNELPEWLENVDLSALEGEEVIYEGDRILEQ